MLRRGCQWFVLQPSLLTDNGVDMQHFSYDGIRVRIGASHVFANSGNYAVMVEKTPTFDMDYAIACRADMPEAEAVKMVMSMIGAPSPAVPTPLSIDIGAYDG